jgi:hypothetical protein
VQNYLNRIPNYVMLGYSIQISKRKHSVTSRSFEKPYKQLELVSHRYIQTLENNLWKHSLSLFIYYVKMGKSHHFCNKICCQTSMFINSRIATIGKYCDVPVYSGKMSWYSAIFSDIPPYSGIPGFHNARLALHAHALSYLYSPI